MQQAQHGEIIEHNAEKFVNFFEMHEMMHAIVRARLSRRSDTRDKTGWLAELRDATDNSDPQNTPDPDRTQRQLLDTG